VNALKRAAAVCIFFLTVPAGRGGDSVPIDPSILRRKNPDMGAVVKLAASAPALPKPKGQVVRVKTAGALYQTVATCKPGTTILLADGVYRLDRSVVIATDRVSLRGASGRREKVILDRGNRGKRGATIVTVADADDVLIADLTCRNSPGHGIAVAAQYGPQRTRIYNVMFHNIWIRHVKGMHPKYPHEPVGPHRAEIMKKRPVGGSIRYCLFVNDRRKTNRRDGFNGDYVGGIDMMWLTDWVIADNVFVGIRGANGVGRGAIFVWVHSENVVAERNLVVNCDRGICFGNPSGSPIHMTRGICRNNFILGGVNTPIEMVRTADTKVYHNTVVAASADFRRGIHFFQGADGGRCFNNLLHGRLYLPKAVTAGHNVAGDLTGWFVNPAIGDLHLTGKASGAIGRARPLKAAGEDFDRQKRKSKPDVGADETVMPGKRSR